MFSNITQGIKELFFPDNCYLCRTYLNNRHQSQLCPLCLSGIQFNTPPFCSVCSRHLKAFCIDGLCTDCRQHKPSFDRAWGACLYQEDMRKLIHAFKYSGKTALNKTFVSLINLFIETYHIPIKDFDIIAPIALHATRFRERGFNQSELLSQALSKHFLIPHLPNLLTRIRATESQTQLDQKQRWTNLEGAFRINDSECIIQKSVLLVDDLLTTSATANAAASALKEAGASYIGVLTLAITE